MSVSEAVDKDFSLLFDKTGVKMFLTSKLKITGGDPIISGVRDPRNRLFYFNSVAQCSVVSAEPSVRGATGCPLKLLPITGPTHIGAGWFLECRLQRNKASQPLDETEPDPVVVNLSRTIMNIRTTTTYGIQDWLTSILDWLLWRSPISKTGHEKLTAMIVFVANFINIRILASDQPLQSFRGPQVSILLAICSGRCCEVLVVVDMLHSTQI
jgi:hypothetical protein